ncbi:MAG: hypothetical protein L0241_04195 [Planctomycetia bacterium]|nr:hypothetical protein [Planctomycetia bacterium]
MRWRLLDRLLHDHNPRNWVRCILVVEELEGREVPAPLVFASSIIPRVDENIVTIVDTETLGGGGLSAGTTFSVFDESSGKPTFVATLTITTGTLNVDEAFASGLGLTVSGDNTAKVTLTGELPQINNFLSFGYEFTPTPFYSGDATISLSVTQQSINDPGTGETHLQVIPIASDVNISIQDDGEVRLPSEPFAFPPGFLSVTNWPDADGSETISVIIQVSSNDPNDEFTLSDPGGNVVQEEPGQWRIIATSATQLQAIFDSITLTPPANFSGRAFLDVFGSVNDDATYFSDLSPENDSNFIFGDFALLRFFREGTVSVQPVTATEGTTVNLSGTIVVDDTDDPDGFFGDSHTLTLSVPRGILIVNPSAVPSGLSVGQERGPDGSSIILSGSIDDINTFLATPGSLSYSPGDAFFSGLVPLTVSLQNIPGSGFSEMPGEASSFGLPKQPSATVQGDFPTPVTVVLSLSFTPVASHVFPSALNVQTNQDTPVGLSISITQLVDTDGSESVLIQLEGVPLGSTVNKGTDLGGGVWVLPATDLDGLVFTPPPGVSGTFTITVKAIVTDSAPELGASDSATEQTTFAIQVNPIVSPTPTPTPIPQLPPPTDNPIFLSIADPIVVGGSLIDTGTTPDTGADRPPTQSTQPVIFTGDSGVSIGDAGLGAPDARANLTPPAQGSLFSQVEAPIPTYTAGEKHPLPSVLPLDQTLPVAGFSESGGDSIALVDKLYRDAGNPDRVILAPTQPPSQVPANENPAERTVPVVATIAGDGTIPAVGEQASQNLLIWGVCAGVGAIVGCVLRARGYGGFLTRGFRRFFHYVFYRQPTEGTI